MRTRLAAILVVLLPTLACVEAPPQPGQLIGAYSFAATPTGPDFTDCKLAGLSDAGFTFGASLRWEPTDGGAWMMVGSVARPATLDGGHFVTTASGTQQFADCSCDKVTVDETMTLELMSASQTAAAGVACPVDGGIPAPDADAGIAAPGPTESGYDAARACGELVDVLTPGAGCTCAACTVRYRLDGARL